MARDSIRAVYKYDAPKSKQFPTTSISAADPLVVNRTAALAHEQVIRGGSVVFAQAAVRKPCNTSAHWTPPDSAGQVDAAQIARASTLSQGGTLKDCTEVIACGSRSADSLWYKPCQIPTLYLHVMRCLVTLTLSGCHSLCLRIGVGIEALSLANM